jgi:hypothetical protein
MVASAFCSPLDVFTGEMDGSIRGIVTDAGSGRVQKVFGGSDRNRLNTTNGQRCRRELSVGAPAVGHYRFEAIVPGFESMFRMASR